jgi:hypothetical protein
VTAKRPGEREEPGQALRRQAARQWWLTPEVTAGYAAPGRSQLADLILPWPLAVSP